MSHEVSLVHIRTITPRKYYEKDKLKGLPGANFVKCTFNRPSTVFGTALETLDDANTLMRQLHYADNYCVITKPPKTALEGVLYHRRYKNEVAAFDKDDVLGTTLKLLDIDDYGSDWNSLEEIYTSFIKEHMQFAQDWGMIFIPSSSALNALDKGIYKGNFRLVVLLDKPVADKHWYGYLHEMGVPLDKSHASRVNQIYFTSAPYINCDYLVTREYNGNTHVVEQIGGHKPEYYSYKVDGVKPVIPTDWELVSSSTGYSKTVNLVEFKKSHKFRKLFKRSAKGKLLLEAQNSLIEKSQDKSSGVFYNNTYKLCWKAMEDNYSPYELIAWKGFLLENGRGSYLNTNLTSVVSKLESLALRNLAETQKVLANSGNKYLASEVIEGDGNRLSDIIEWTHLINTPHKFVALKGKTGCGKTTIINELINNLPDHYRVLTLTNFVSLINDIHSHRPTEHKVMAGHEYTPDKGRAITTCQGLTKIGKTFFDIVVIDEVTTVLDFLFSTLVDRTAADGTSYLEKVIDILKTIIGNAEKVIIADQDLDQGSLEDFFILLEEDINAISSGE